MRVTPTAIKDVWLVQCVRHGDERGYFLETFRQEVLAAAGLDFGFVQDNESLSPEVGTVRGLHFQVPPRPQGKLVRVVRGAVLDVAVDVRSGSPSYGQHVAVELSAGACNQLWVPPGFAHGICTLLPDTILAYKVTSYWSAEHERFLRWNDPALGIDWPVSADRAVLNARDRSAPCLSELEPWPQANLKS